MTSVEVPIELFYSYAHEDEQYRIELEKYLAYMRRKGTIATWYDRRISAGASLDGTISEYLERAHIILCLLSADFAASDYVNDVELKRALERLDRGEARVVGIVIRPIPQGFPLDRRILIPTDAKPIITWDPVESGYVDVVTHLQRVVDEIRAELARRGQSSKGPARERIWSVPKRNPAFVGRDPDLTQLRETLTNKPSPSIAAIIGLPGVGKSQLAFEYAYRYAEAYPVAWAIRAQDTESMVADLSALAERLGVAGEGAGRESERSNTSRGRREAPIPTGEGQPSGGGGASDVAVDAVLQWLAANKDWLLIFDNATNLASLSSYLPRRGTGHVIITSREDIWRPIARTIVLETFNDEESVRFLLTRVGSDSPADTAAARRLAKSLGDMPLALEHAASFVTVSNKTLAEYHALIDAVTGDRPALDDPVGRIAATWAVSLGALGNDSPPALLFDVCAWLAPEDIPRSIFSSGIKYLGETLAKTVADPLAFADAIAQLVRYGLVRVRGDAFSTHRLVQRAAQDRFSPEKQHDAVSRVIHLLDAVYPDADSIPDATSWDECERYLPHVVTATSRATLLKAELPGVARLLWRVGDYQAERARYLEAKSTLDRALSIAQVTHGLNHPLVADIQNSLGNVLLDSGGDYDGARRRYEAALAVDRALGEEQTHNAAIHLNNLGFALEQQGQLALAQAYYSQSREIELHLGERAEAAKTMLNIGSIHETLGDVVKARSLYEEAIAIQREAGAERNELADALSALGSLLLDEGDAAGARAYLTEALDLNHSVYKADDHPEIARNLTNLGRVSLAAGDLAEARGYVDDALGMYGRVFGVDALNPSLGAVYHVLGEIHEAANRPEEAKHAYETALRHDEGKGNTTSLGVAEDLEAIGRMLLALGNREEAIGRYQHAYRLYVNAYGADHKVPQDIAGELAKLGAPVAATGG
jgi:tetratricopeptide (TPR) repeat protein